MEQPNADARHPGLWPAAPQAIALRRGVAADQRLRSLDAFRGLVIATMILVNNPGSASDVYAPLRHASWHGCTVADLVFPFFLFIVGVAITFSIGARLSDPSARGDFYKNVARRSLVMFALGVFLNGFPLFDWSEIRIPGVLQRLAVCYAAAAALTATLRWRAIAAVAVALTLGHWAALVLVPVPGRTGADAFALGTNLAGYVDSLLLHGHLLHPDWDPEGILGTIPALSTTLAGVLTGQWLRTQPRPLAGLAAAGAIAVALGLALDPWCPINKTLWTTSYVIFTTGVAALALAFCYWLIDLRGSRRWAVPLVAYGTNSIAIYVLSTLVEKEALLWRVTRPDGSSVDLHRAVFEAAFQPLAPAVPASLLYALTVVAVWLGIAIVLHRGRVFIKI